MTRAAHEPKTSAGQKGGEPIATIRDRAGHEAVVAKNPQLARVSAEWAYILRSRRRWADDGAARETLRKRALDDLGALGVDRDTARSLATSDCVEVEIHDNGDESQLDIASSVPWEYLLSAATREVGRSQPVWLYRLIQQNTRSAVRRPSKPRFLFIESAPGRLEGRYDFASEERRIFAAARVSQKGFTYSRTETVARIKKHVEESSPQIIHLTAIDPHQACGFIGQFDTSVDGVVLRSELEPELCVDHRKLAGMLTSGKPPRLVTFNLYYSASKTARDVVRAHRERFTTQITSDSGRSSIT